MNREGSLERAVGAATPVRGPPAPTPHGKDKGSDSKSRTLSDLHVRQISDVVVGQPLHVEPELHDKALTCANARGSSVDPARESRLAPRRSEITKRTRQRPNTYEVCRPSRRATSGSCASTASNSTLPIPVWAGPPAAMRRRPPRQLPLQHGELLLAQPRQRRGTFGPQSPRTTFDPCLPPSLHRPHTDAQILGDHRTRLTRANRSAA